MCNKAVDDYAHALEFVPDQYKPQKICIRAVDNYLFTIKYVPDRYKTQEMCIRAVNVCLILFPIDTRPKKWVIKVLMIILMH